MPQTGPARKIDKTALTINLSVEQLPSTRVAGGGGICHHGVMRTYLRAKSGGWKALLTAFLGLLLLRGSLDAAPYHGSLYTPVREHQAIGPLPVEPIAYYPYIPRQIHRLEDLPAAVRARAVSAVEARVGAAFFARLRFAGGEAVNLRELHRVNPDSRRFSTEVPAYTLHWEFEMPEAGIRNYTATVTLRQDGSVLGALDLPDFATKPGKVQLVSLSKVSQDLIKKKLIDPASATATITYDGKADSLVWHFEQPLPGSGPEVKVRSVDVNAHTGSLLQVS